MWNELTQIRCFQEYPPWGTFYGVILQGVRSSASKTEVEITVIATEDMRAYPLLISAHAGIDTVVRSAQHTAAHQIVRPGKNKFEMYATTVLHGRR